MVFHSRLTALFLAVVTTAPFLAQSAHAENCLWIGGDGNFLDKNKWTPCRPGKKDNVVIGSAFLSNSTGNVTISREIAEFHNLYVARGSGVTINLIAKIYGNVFENSGTLTIRQNSNIRPLFRSYSKNLIISARGAIVLDNGELAGNMTIGSGQIVTGAGQIGADSERLFNDGVIEANLFGKEIVFNNAINGVGTFRATNGASLHFTRDSSGDNLVNNGRIQLEGANFQVARDYSGQALGSGNSFDARRTVIGTGQILAADATQNVSGPNLAGDVINFGAMRVGGRASTSLTLSNTGALTTLRGAVQNSRAPNVKVTNADFVLAAGGPVHTASLTFTGSTAGRYSGQVIDVVNNFDNVADDHFAVLANVYAPAIASLSSTAVNFGTVRKGAAGVVSLVRVSNLASGALTDQLLTSVDATPARISVASTPGALAAGRTGDLVFALDTGIAGLVAGASRISFKSHDSELQDLVLGSQPVNFQGKVTDPAVAALALQSGYGLFMGGDADYTLDLGDLDRDSGSFRSDIAVINAVTNSLVSELLGGRFELSGDSAFSFTGEGVDTLPAGGRDTGNFIAFDTGNLAAGRYQGVLTFFGFSRYPGLQDLALAPVRLTIRANVTAVPEPGTFALLLVGLGAIAGVMRRRQDMAAGVERGVGRSQG